MTGSLASSIERARRGDVAAFDEIVRALHAPLVRFTAAILGGDVHTAHDVVQETFIALWSALPTLAEPRYVQAWLYRVAYRRAVSWIRRRGPGGRPFGALGPDGDEPVGPAAPGPARTWNVGGAWVPSEEATPRLKAALGSLPALYAAPLTLYYLESVDLRETARLLGLTVPTLKMRLHRGRELLRTRVLTKEPWLPIRTRRPKPPPPPQQATPPAHVAESGGALPPSDSATGADGPHPKTAEGPPCEPPAAAVSSHSPSSELPSSDSPSDSPSSSSPSPARALPHASAGTRAIDPPLIERALP